ncbi:MAG: DNA polymerase III subunit delta' [Deltaproteobacteria bacterium]|nr:DNA polymerase III subunit delta' [Deltaproteobacteria bacterium]|tara:strand:+ start:5861 stop:6856 length:996 start_codon:yes stop_codon:yes gene_type:complete
MGFSDIVGQTRAIGDLKRAYTHGRVPNAYLFVGPSGIGKRKTALTLARLLNCEGERSDVEPCEICPSCRKILHNNHTDVWSIAPEKNTIKIQQIRHMQRMVRFPPNEAKMRVVIVDGVESMNIESSNAFLKILEEPPPDNLFVLLGESSSRLLPTIISRCQRVSFVPIARDLLQKVLVEAHGLDPIKAQIAAGIAEGSIGKALQMSEVLLGPERREFLQDLPDLHAPYTGVTLAMNWAEKVAQSGTHIPLYLDQIRMWLRDVMFLKEIEGAEQYVINQDCLPELRRHAQLISTEQIYTGIHAIEDAQYALSRNVSPLLSLEKMFLTLGGAA